MTVASDSRAQHLRTNIGTVPDYVTRTVEQLLVEAAAAVVPIETENEPWEYGWCVESYRRSGRAALPSPSGTVTIGPSGLDCYEESVRRLARESAIRERWDSEELWGLVATLVVATAAANDPLSFVTRNVERLREAGPSLVVMPIANVTWASPPMQVAGGVFGALENDFLDAVASSANGRPNLSDAAAGDWVQLQRNPQRGEAESSATRDVVVAAWWTVAQARLATELATRWLEDICCLVLLLRRGGRGPQPWSLRGDHNRPGARGLAVERSTLQAVLGANPHGAMDLAFQPLALSPTFGAHRPVHWYSADPVPLDELLLDAGQDRLTAALDSSAVAKRLRVAARWYADGHWSRDADDAALALGVALDAIVGSRSALPGRVMAQRFALLDEVPSRRRGRVARYNEVFAVRSAVAHGGQPSRLTEEGFVRSVADDVRCAADRLLEFGRLFPSSSEAELDSSFDALLLGTAVWPTAE